MRFSIQVGELERNLVEFNHSQLLGLISIKVNNQEIKRHTWLLNEPLEEVHTINVGKEEHHTVRIEKQRKPLMGNRCCVFLNDRLYKYFEGI